MILKVGGKCTWWAPQASTLIDGFCVNAVEGSIPSPSRHLYFLRYYPNINHFNLKGKIYFTFFKLLHLKI